ncbi:type II toxin-antitoxin system VapC family toxin [Candidatus Woesearchaeota archaeon]|nr:type II toxin-antitoxin system VapC family toxin [Candidatus Woesearchaeota archaeon]
MEESSTFYVDANIFVYSIVNNENLGNKCRLILNAIQNSTIVGITSCLTFDEILWSIRKIDPESVIEAGVNILNLNLKFIEVNKTILYKTLEIMKEFNLKPRDAIHAATMKVYNIKNLISEDLDFDKIPWLKRKSIKEFKI